MTDGVSQMLGRWATMDRWSCQEEL